MPIYEFKCASCGHVFGELRRIGDFSPPPCPQCGSQETEKVFSLFAGSGSGGKDCSSCSGSHTGRCSSCH